MSNWVDAINKLPETSGEYLVYVRDPCSFHETHADDMTDIFDFGTSFVTTAFYQKDECLWKQYEDEYYCANLECVNIQKVHHISHWMPLPAGPET